MIATDARRVALRLRASTLLKEYEVMEAGTGASLGLPRLRRSFPEQRGMSWEIPCDEQSSLAANVGVEQQRHSARVSSAWSLSSIVRVPRPPPPMYTRPAPPRATTAMLIATRRMLTENAGLELAAVISLSRTFRSDRALQRTVAKVRRHCPERPSDVIATTLPGNDAEVHVAWTSGGDALDGAAIQSYAVEADPPLPESVHLDAKESSVVVQTGGNAAAPGRTFVVVARTAAGYRSASRRVALTRSAEKLWVSLTKKRAAPAAAPKQKKSALTKAKEEALAVGETFSPNPRLAAHFAQRAEYAKRAAAAAKAEKMRKAKVVVRRSPMGAAGGRRMLFDAYGQSVESVQQRVAAAEKQKREAKQRIEARVKSIEQGLKPQLPPPEIQVGRVRGDHLASRRVFTPANPRPCVLDEHGTTFAARERTARTLSGARRAAASKSTKGEARRDAERAERRRVELAKRVAKAAAGNAVVAARRAKAATRSARAAASIRKASGPVRRTPAKTAAKTKFKVSPRAQPRERTERAGAPEQWRKDSRGSWIGTGNTQTHPKLKSTTRAPKRGGAKRAEPKGAAGAGRDAYGRRRERPVMSAAPPTPPAADVEVEVEVAPAVVDSASAVETGAAEEAEAAAAAQVVAEAEACAAKAAAETNPAAEAKAAAAAEQAAAAKAEAEAKARLEAEAAVAAAAAMAATEAKVAAEADAAAEAGAAAKAEAEAKAEASAAAKAVAEAAAEIAAKVESHGADDAEADGAAAPIEDAPEPERPTDLFEGGGNFVGPLSDDSRDVMIFLAERGECTWAAMGFGAPEEGSEERGEAASTSKAHGTWVVEGDDLVLSFVSKTTTATGEEAVTEAFETGSEERFVVPLAELRNPREWRRA